MDTPARPDNFANLDAAPKHVQIFQLGSQRQAHDTGPMSGVRTNDQADWDVPVFNPAGEEEGMCG